LDTRLQVKLIKNPNAQCWIRIQGLVPNTLCAMAKGIKIPPTSSKKFGYFAITLVNLDLMKKNSDFLLVEHVFNVCIQFF
jgi:hypothetical protein